MKKLLSVAAFAICALFSASAAISDLPSWVLGTWAGQVVNYVPDEGKTYDGFYKLTLTSTGTKEKYKWNDEEDPDSGSGTNKLKGWKITEQENCHVVATCWYGSDSGDDSFDAKYVFCNPDVSCTHYTNKSTYYAKMGDEGDTVNANLAKLEMNTAPAEGWPKWVLGKWTGPIEIWIPDKGTTDTGYAVFTLTSNASQCRLIWNDPEDPDRDVPLYGWKITEQSDCHVVATTWCWGDDEDRVYDVKCVFRKPDVNCTDYDKSIAYIKERNDLKEHNDGECETGTMSLTKDEDNLVPAEGWPEWVLGTWKGDANNWHASSGKYEYGTYELTLTSKGSKEKIVLEGESSESSDDAKGWKITEKAECHIVATAWCWDDEEDDKFDAKYVFRNPNVNCSHYANSSFYQKMRLYGDTVECSNLKKDIRIVCHYTNIVGTVGQELRKPNGDHYFDVDWFDCDTPAGQVSGDNDPKSYTTSGWLPGNPSSFKSAYKKSVKEKPSDTQSWYNDWDSYHPIIVTPTKAGVYNFTMTFTWKDKHTESITITFDIKPASTVPVNIDESYGPFVPGAEVSFAIPELAGYAAKGLPSGLKFDKNTGAITGAAKKPTGDAGQTVTFTKKGAEELTTQFIVGAIPKVSVSLDGDTEKCKVSGGDKTYLAGKTVKLTAKAPKGTAFVGWTETGTSYLDAESLKNAKLTFEMPEGDIALVAKFEKEKMSVACPKLAESSYTVGVAGDAADGLPLEIEAQSGVKSVKAKSLPKGMKLVVDKETGAWSITGTPSKPGTYNVVITVTAASGATESITIPVTVAALPDWAQGTFVGTGHYVIDSEDPYEGGDSDYYCELKINANGKFSGKIIQTVESGNNSCMSWTTKFSEPSLELSTNGAYYAETAINFKYRYNGEVKTAYRKVGMLISSADSAKKTTNVGVIVGEVANEQGTPIQFGTLNLDQDIWKIKNFADKPVIAKAFPLHSAGKNEDGYSAYMDITIKPNGAVTGVSVVTSEYDGKTSTFKDKGKGQLVVTGWSDEEQGWTAEVPFVYSNGETFAFDVFLPVGDDGKVDPNRSEFEWWFDED